MISYISAGKENIVKNNTFSDPQNVKKKNRFSKKSELLIAALILMGQIHPRR
jgi:hypothetical protein